MSTAGRMAEATQTWKTHQPEAANESLKAQTLFQSVTHYLCVYVGLSRGFSKKLFIQLEGSIKITRPFAACTRSVLTCAYVREFQ